MSEKHKARLASFVIFEHDGKILLARRFNTGYSDGFYQMPSGHVEEHEYPSEAAIREMKEEVGVDIEPKDLIPIHISHRINTNSAGDYVDFFFKTSKWSGEIRIAEPDKCDELIWVAMDDLPENTVPVIREVVAHILENQSYSEIGRLEDKKS